MQGRRVSSHLRARLLDTNAIGRSKVPSQITNDSGKETQNRVWVSHTKKLDAIEPGCVGACIGAQQVAKG